MMTRAQLDSLEAETSAYRARIATAENEIAYLRAELAAARAALEPFARWGEPDIMADYEMVPVTMADCRRARAAMGELGG